MSQVRPDVDLAALARSTPPLAPPKRSRLRVIVPAVILLVFGALLFSTLGDLWKGSVEVTVIRPRVIDASSSAADGVALFQAAGWVEPEPFAIEATALAAGVVDSVLVQPSDAVRRGDVIARLIDSDARLSLRAAEAMLAEAKAELARAEAEDRAARENFELALNVTQSIDVARAELDGRIAEAEHRAQAAIAAQARVHVTEEELVLQRELAAAGAAGPRQVEIATARIEEAKADLAVMQADAALARADAEKARANFARAERDRATRVDERRAVETAKAIVEVARAKVAAIQVSCDEAKLRLERMEVRAPADGIVLERLASPGTAIGADGAAVCTLYDPMSIRVRVDIPQGEVGKVGVGMRAEVLSESRPNRPYHGEVIRLVHKADIQKVTLQVHVRIDDADALVRPEMLVQARFLSSGSSNGVAETGATVTLVPARLLADGNSIWVVDGATRTALLRRVELGARQGDEVEVKSGVNASDKLIDGGRDGLQAGARVTVKEQGTP